MHYLKLCLGVSADIFYINVLLVTGTWNIVEFCVILFCELFNLHLFIRHEN